MKRPIAFLSSLTLAVLLAGGVSGESPRSEKPRPDRVIGRDVDALLQFDPRLDAEEIAVRVENGRVVLSGKVDSQHLRELAHEIAHRVNGVDQVVNRIVVDPGPESTIAGGDELRETIIKNIRDQALLGPEDHVEVTVEREVAYLEGAVDSTVEHTIATRAAFAAGAEAVYNSLAVRSLSSFPLPAEMTFYYDDPSQLSAGDFSTVEVPWGLYPIS